MLSAWIGAAILFVITSIAEQTSPEFESMVRDQLATIRFPLYYQFGFACHALALILGVFINTGAPPELKRRSKIVVALIALSFVLICLDFNYVYQPLQDSITPPGQVRTQEFVRLHNLSRRANEFHLMVMLTAAVIASIPNPLPQNTATKSV